MTEVTEEHLCIHCGEEIREEYRHKFSYIDAEGHEIEIRACSRCFEIKYVKCKACNQPNRRETMIKIQPGVAITSSVMCRTCAPRRAWKCSRCNRWFMNSINSSMNTNGRMVCSDCFNQNYFICSGCHTTLLHQYNSGNGRCMNCELGGIQVPETSPNEHEITGTNVWFKKDEKTKQIIEDPKSEI